MTLTGNNAITLRKLTSKVAAEKGIPLKEKDPVSSLRWGPSVAFCFVLVCFFLA